jgi:hypothetical protein
MLKPAKSVGLQVNIWYNERSGHIHIAAKDAFISTVSNDPASRRYHPNLFGKMARRLREHGVPAPRP